MSNVVPAAVTDPRPTPLPPRSEAPRRRWADRAAGALCGAGLFAAGLASAEHLGPGGGNRAVADGGTGVREVSAMRAELDADDNRPLLDGGDALARVSRLASPSVVHIESRYDGDEGGVEETGSGVIARHPSIPGTYVLTNRHVVAGGVAGEDGPRFVSSSGGLLDGVELQLADGRTVSPARVWLDEATDLAVLKIDDVDLPAVKFGNSDLLDPGHFVMALGSPFGLSRSVTLGIVSAKSRRRLDLGSKGLINQDFLQTDASINPGNSGGPLVDLRGRLVGINTAIASSSGGSEGIGFSIPVNLVKRVFDEMLTHGRVRRSYLGVQLDDRFGPRDARRLGLPKTYGARVQSVRPDTPAFRAGLKPWDVLLRFGSVEIEDLDHLINLVSLTPLGERVRLTVLRDGRQVPMTIALTDERGRRNGE